MKLILISPETFWHDERETLIQLFESGLQAYHLRKPLASTSEVFAFLRSIPSRFHSRIILHYQFDCAENFDLKGLHFNARNAHYAKVYSRKLVPCYGSDVPNVLSATNSCLSYSAHSFEELLRGRDLYNYQFLSPIFDSISKEGYQAAFSLEEVQDFTQQNPTLHTVALGGVMPNRIPLLREAGFWGVAVLGQIWKTDYSISERLKQFEKLCHHL